MMHRLALPLHSVRRQKRDASYFVDAKHSGLSQIHIPTQIKNDVVGGQSIDCTDMPVLCQTFGLYPDSSLSTAKEKQCDSEQCKIHLLLCV